MDDLRFNRDLRVVEVNRGDNCWYVVEPHGCRNGQDAMVFTAPTQQQAFDYIRKRWLSRMPDYCPELYIVPSATNLITGSVTYDLTAVVAYMNKFYPEGWDKQESEDAKAD